LLLFREAFEQGTDPGMRAFGRTLLAAKTFCTKGHVSVSSKPVVRTYFQLDEEFRTDLRWNCETVSTASAFDRIFSLAGPNVSAPQCEMCVEEGTAGSACYRSTVVFGIPRLLLFRTTSEGYTQGQAVFEGALDSVVRGVRESRLDSLEKEACRLEQDAKAAPLYKQHEALSAAREARKKYQQANIDLMVRRSGELAGTVNEDEGGHWELSPCLALPTDGRKSWGYDLVGRVLQSSNAGDHLLSHFVAEPGAKVPYVYDSMRSPLANPVVQTSPSAPAPNTVLAVYAFSGGEEERLAAEACRMDLLATSHCIWVDAEDGHGLRYVDRGASVL